MNKVDLYIDFHGVIYDTLPVLNGLLKKNDISNRDLISIKSFLETINWCEFMDKSKQINDSIYCMRQIMDSEVFNVFVLAQVMSMNEIGSIVKCLRKQLPEVVTIPVPRDIEKVDMVPPKNAILIDDNLDHVKEWVDQDGIGIHFSNKKNIECNVDVINRLDKLLELFDYQRGYRPKINEYMEKCKTRK